MKTHINNRTLLPFLFMVLSFFSTTSFAEDISYGYDNAGNRVIRQVIMLRSPVKKNVANDTTKIVSSWILQTEIHIFPNPTRRLLQVNFSTLTHDNPTEIILYNSTGVVLQHRTATGLLEQIDMSNYSSGWYVLRVKVGKKYKEFKIIKE